MEILFLVLLPGEISTVEYLMEFWLVLDVLLSQLAFLLCRALAASPAVPSRGKPDRLLLRLAVFAAAATVVGLRCPEAVAWPSGLAKVNFVLDPTATVTTPSPPLSPNASSSYKLSSARFRLTRVVGRPHPAGARVPPSAGAHDDGGVDDGMEAAPRQARTRAGSTTTGLWWRQHWWDLLLLLRAARTRAGAFKGSISTANLLMLALRLDLISLISAAAAVDRRSSPRRRWPAFLRLL